LISAVMRLRTRDGLFRVLRDLRGLQEVLLNVAGRHVETIVQAYTHLQPAQITTFGHYLLSFVDVFERDAARLDAAFRTTNISPLGGAATSGSSYAFDRSVVAALLGFDGVVENTKDAGHHYDWLAQAVAAASIFMSSIGRLAWDLYIWCSDEFGLVTIDGAFAASSSIMPQKRNPYSLEMIKARASELASAPTTIINVLHGDSGGTAFDIKLVGQSYAAHVLDRTADMARLLGGVVGSLQVNEARMAASAGSGFSSAVGLIDHLCDVHALPFRTAHLVVGSLVRLADASGLAPTDVDAELLDRAAVEVTGTALGLTDEEVRSALDPHAFLASRVTEGGPQPEEVRRMHQARFADAALRGQELEKLEAKVATAMANLLEGDVQASAA
jgi:argininosuccinate lyase